MPEMAPARWFPNIMCIKHVVVAAHEKPFAMLTIVKLWFTLINPISMVLRGSSSPSNALAVVEGPEVSHQPQGFTEVITRVSPNCQGLPSGRRRRHKAMSTVEVVTPSWSQLNHRWATSMGDRSMVKPWSCSGSNKMRVFTVLRSFRLLRLVPGSPASRNPFPIVINQRCPQFWVMNLITIPLRVDVCVKGCV